MDKRVLITGSRNWADVETLTAALEEELAQFCFFNQEGALIVVQGGARGADKIAWDWALNKWESGAPVESEVHPADWEHYGKAAGHIRNKQMVDLGADVCLAFPLGDSHGTRGCMKLAEKAGIKVINFDPDQ